MSGDALADAELGEAGEGLQLRVTRRAVHFVAFVEEEAREIGAVLSGDAEDEGAPSVANRGTLLAVGLAGVVAVVAGVVVAVVGKP